MPNAPIVGKSFSGHLKIPQYAIYNNKYYTVTQTSKYCFRHCYYITSVSIPNSIEFLDTDTFWNTSISYLFVPSSVKALASYCFSRMEQLKKIEFGEGIVLNIPNGCFYRTYSLNEIVFPSNAIFPNSAAFEFTNLTNIYVCGLIPYTSGENHFSQSFASSVNIYVRNGYSSTTFLGKTVNIMTNEEYICRFYRKPIIITCQNECYQHYSSRKK